MITYLNPYYLQYFVDAVELGSISASAQKNLISHPAVSRAIKNLENELQIKLLIHQKKSFEVTEEGFQFAFEAKKTLLHLENLSNDSLVHKMNIKGSFSLGLSRTLGQIYLKRIILILEKQYPEVQLNIFFGTTNDLTAKLLEGTLDSCITIGKQTIPMLIQTKLKEGKFVLIQGSRKNLSISENLSEFILTEPRYETELLKKQVLKKFQKNLHIKHQVGSWEVICDLVASNLGIGLVPELLIDKNKEYQIIKQSFFDYPYEIFYNKLNGPQTQLQKVMRELIADIARD
jgi:DNA-binding transcriptional LysR family regulator